MENFSPTQQAAVHWLAATTAVISFCCSSTLVVHILLHPNRKTYHRLVLGLSFFDIVASLTMFTARFLDLEEPSRACSNVAALQVVSVGTAGLYNGSLAVLFLLLVKFNAPERTIVKYFEVQAHMGCILGSAIIAISAYSLDSLNPVPISAICWLSSYPPGCQGDECTHGRKWGFFFEEFSQVMFYLLVIIIAVSNFLIYYKVYKTLGRNRRYSVEPSQNNAPRHRLSVATIATDPRRRHSLESRDTGSHDSSMAEDPSPDSYSPPRGEGPSPEGKALRRSSLVDNAESKTRQVAIRSFLFCGGFAITYFFGVVVLETPERMQGTRWYYMFLILDSIFWPLQGFWDSLIYFRPRYIQWRAACPTNGRFFAWRKTVFTMQKPKAEKRRSKAPARMAANNDQNASGYENELSFSQEMERCEALSAV